MNSVAFWDLCSSLSATFSRPPRDPLPLSSTVTTQQRIVRVDTFEGRPVKPTLKNPQGVDSLARNRPWRSQCVFRIDVGRPVKQGIKAVHVFPGLQVERAGLTSREHSSSPTSTWSSLTKPCQRTTNFSACTHASGATIRAFSRLLGR